jgi:hypothetical protein
MYMLPPPRGKRGVKAEFRESDDESYYPETAASSTMAASPSKLNNQARSTKTRPRGKQPTVDMPRKAPSSI